MTVRARDLGIGFSGVPGPLNAITDVAGVEVGHCTLHHGSGPRNIGHGPVRTGVTAILPRGRSDPRLCFAGSFALNAAGEMTGLNWIAERGMLEGPVLLTNTHAVGIVRDATVQWMRQAGWQFDWTIPVVGETYDGLLNDIDGGHIRAEHAFAALDGARSGHVDEGNVGGGTGMICYEFKGGIGSASRVVAKSEGGYTIGVLVQANYGRRQQLRIGGCELGRILTADMPSFTGPGGRPAFSSIPYAAAGEHQPEARSGDLRDGSIIVVVATDAPLLPHQLARLAKRPAMGIGRLGGTATTASGEIFMAFSTANGGVSEHQDARSSPSPVLLHPNAALSSLFEATVEAAEEAIVNALVAARTSTGADDLTVHAIPHERLRAIFGSTVAGGD